MSDKPSDWYQSGFAAGLAGFNTVVRQRDEIQAKLDREVAAHRENVLLLHAAVADRDAMAKHFMDLHDAAKKFVGPKIKTTPISPEKLAEILDLPGRAQMAADGE